MILLKSHPKHDFFFLFFFFCVINVLYRNQSWALSQAGPSFVWLIDNCSENRTVSLPNQCKKTANTFRHETLPASRSQPGCLPTTLPPRLQIYKNTSVSKSNQLIALNTLSKAYLLLMRILRHNDSLDTRDRMCKLSIPASFFSSIPINNHVLRSIFNKCHIIKHCGDCTEKQALMFSI